MLPSRAVTLTVAVEPVLKVPVPETDAWASMAAAVIFAEEVPSGSVRVYDVMSGWNLGLSVPAEAFRLLSFTYMLPLPLGQAHADEGMFVYTGILKERACALSELL